MFSTSLCKENYLCFDQIMSISCFFFNFCISAHSGSLCEVYMEVYCIFWVNRSLFYLTEMCPAVLLFVYDVVWLIFHLSILCMTFLTVETFWFKPCGNSTHRTILLFLFGMDIKHHYVKKNFFTSSYTCCLVSEIFKCIKNCLFFCEMVLGKHRSKFLLRDK